LAASQISVRWSRFWHTRLHKGGHFDQGNFGCRSSSSLMAYGRSAVPSPSVFRAFASKDTTFTTARIRLPKSAHQRTGSGANRGSLYHKRSFRTRNSHVSKKNQPPLHSSRLRSPPTKGRISATLSGIQQLHHYSPVLAKLTQAPQFNTDFTRSALCKSRKLSDFLRTRRHLTFPCHNRPN